jgi:ssDNA-binding Zn-finger/Zn-ribbon topoisomerase 1
MAVRTSRFGRFLACDKYPDCKYVEKIQGKAVEKIQDKAVEKIQDKAVEKIQGKAT